MVIVIKLLHLAHFSTGISREAKVEWFYYIAFTHRTIYTISLLAVLQHGMVNVGLC